jgi:hypothetical protein
VDRLPEYFHWGDSNHGPDHEGADEGDARQDLEGMNCSVVIVVGGQAGLSMSCCLTQRGVDHVVLERDRVGHDWVDRQVVLATSPYQVPRIRRLAGRLPDEPAQMHSSQYRNPGQPDRRVHLAVGSAPRGARFYRGRDVVAWLEDIGYYRKAVSEFADADTVRFRVNHYVTGRDGGRDIDLRAFARDGMRMYGRLVGATGAALRFAPDLAKNLDHADAVSESIKDSIDSYIDAHHIDAPPEPRVRRCGHPSRSPPSWISVTPGSLRWPGAPVSVVTIGGSRFRCSTAVATLRMTGACRPFRPPVSVDRGHLDQHLSCRRTVLYM